MNGPAGRGLFCAKDSSTAIQVLDKRDGHNTEVEEWTSESIGTKFEVGIDLAEVSFGN